LTILILIIVGLFAGTLSGLLGIGGGTVFTPVLFFFFDRAGVENPELWTIGTSLFCTFAASTGGSLKHLHQQSAFLRESLAVGVFGVIGTTVGKLIATSEWFSREEYLVLIAVVFMYTGINFLLKSYKTRNDVKEIAFDRLIRKRDAITVGGAGGFLASISGLGGGVLMVPIMNMGYKYSLRKSVSISEFAIVVISLAGFAQFALQSPMQNVTSAESVISVTKYTVGYVDLGLSLPMVFGAFVGAGFGVWLHDRINTSLIKFIFGLLIVGVSIRMAFELF
jgi:uncharacterized membrane protein YfcA